MSVHCILFNILPYGFAVGACQRSKIKFFLPYLTARLASYVSRVLVKLRLILSP